MVDTDNIIEKKIKESINIKQNLLSDKLLLHNISILAQQMAEAISCGGKILVCGNGGSASDALHLVGELVGRFQKERQAWSAIALNADIATMTAIANDYGYDYIFERAVEAYMTPNDLLLGISTSGNSQNVYNAILKAQAIGGKTAALLGKDGGKIVKDVDLSIVINTSVTARVQECHIMIIHILCELIELGLTENE